MELKLDFSTGEDYVAGPRWPLPEEDMHGEILHVDTYGGVSIGDHTVYSSSGEYAGQVKWFFIHPGYGVCGRYVYGGFDDIKDLRTVSSPKEAVDYDEEFTYGN